MNILFQHVLVVAGFLAAAVMVVMVLQQRRTPQSAVAWILFLVLVPYLAVPVFVALGFRKAAARSNRIEFGTGSADTDGSAVGELFHRLGGPPVHGGNRIELQDTPSAAQDALDSVLDSARQRLDILFYIIDDDPSGRRFVERLTELAKSGVDVRLSLDRLGTLSRPKPQLRRLAEAGGQIRFFSPFFMPPARGHMNLRNHRKLVVADRTLAWSGGRNVGDLYFDAEKGWSDLSFTVAGPVVQNFLDIFDSDWKALGGDPEPLAWQGERAGEARLQILPAGPDDPGDTFHDGLVGAIHRADRRVWVATPYFVPTEPLLQALATAARRGVDVRILVPLHSNKRITDFARGAYLRDLSRAGARVLCYRDGMLHSKTGVVDDAAWVGSANFDVRSMLLNFEMVLFAYDADTVAQLSEWFTRHAAAADEGVDRARLPRRVMEGVFRLGAPVL